MRAVDCTREDNDIQYCDSNLHMNRPMTNKQNGMCAQRRLRSAWASAQSDQSLRCPHGGSLGPWLPIERTVKTLISLGGCPGWSESSLVAHTILLVLYWGGSTVLGRDRHWVWGPPRRRAIDEESIAINRDWAFFSCFIVLTKTNLRIILPLNLPRGEIVNFMVSRESMGTYFPRELTTQTDRYMTMTGQGLTLSRPSIHPGDAEAAPWTPMCYQIKISLDFII